ncbi:MAG TPA: VWA domain-containing protein [Dongiaceae bacterium]|nr:VWA domain-containing protein [Dongiaceae bacterium]
MAMRTLGIFSLAVLILAASRAASAQTENKNASEQQPGFQSQVDLVSVYFTVRDGQKRLVSDLPQDSFRVVEDGQPQAIKFFAHHTDVVLNVGVLLDTGTHMSWILDEEGHAASMFLRHVVRPSDLAFVVGYAAEVDTLQLPTSDMALLQASVRNVQSGGGEVGPAPEGTAPTPDIGVGGGGTVGINGKPVQMRREAHLYDALRYSAEHHLNGEVGRKAVVVVALSGDAKSQSKLEDALEALLQNDVIAYVLQIYDAPHRHDGHDNCDVIHTYARDEHGEYVLRKLAESTGGRMLEVKGMDRISEALDEISEELHHQYSLGYYPDNRHWDGKFRKIQIITGSDGYKVYARKGYYAKRPHANAATTQP